jgi:hypothetical protein
MAYKAQSSIEGESHPHALPEPLALYRPKSLKWAEGFMQTILPKAKLIHERKKKLRYDLLSATLRL